MEDQDRCAPGITGEAAEVASLLSRHPAPAGPHSLAEHEWMAESIPDRLRHLEHDHHVPGSRLDPYRRGMDQGTSQALGRIHREYPHTDSAPEVMRPVLTAIREMGDPAWLAGDLPYGSRRGPVPAVVELSEDEAAQLVASFGPPPPEQLAVSELDRQVREAHRIIAILVHRLGGAATVVTLSEMTELGDARIWCQPHRDGLRVGIWPGSVSAAPDPEDLP